MNIQILDPSNVLVDGVNFGAVADTIANNPNLASSIQTALQDWWQEKQQAFTDEKLAITAQQQQAVTDAVANANAQSSAEIANYKAQIAALTAELEAIKNPPAPVENWAGLASDLLGSALFVKVRGFADQSLQLSNAYTDLGLSLYTVRHWDSFVRSVNLTQAALYVLKADFTEEELNLLDQVLVENGFPSLPE